MTSPDPPAAGLDSGADISRAIPDADVMAKAWALPVYDHKGAKVTFGSVIENKKTIVVFVRHFYCGNCQKYVTALSKVPSSALEAAGAALVVVGCGEWNPIDFYAETTSFSGPIYTDPSRELFKVLGMTTETLEVTPAGDKKKSYLGSSLVVTVLQSMGKMLAHPSYIGKQGNIKQIGGDFIFGPGPICSFASIMRHTEDHMEVEDLMRMAGVNI